MMMLNPKELGSNGRASGTVEVVVAGNLSRQDLCALRSHHVPTCIVWGWAVAFLRWIMSYQGVESGEGMQISCP